MDALNLSNVSISQSGNVTFSGLSSGLDFQAIVDAIITAKKIPADRIQLEIDENAGKIGEYQNFRDLLSELKDTLSTLHGAVSVDKTDDIFEAKAAYASTSRTDGSPPAAAANLVGMALTNEAALGSHTLEVLNIATAHKVSSDLVASETAALGFAGTFTINGVSITTTATDTLQDVRDRINNANTGASPTGVNASIVTAASGQNFLVLTADETGTTMTLADTSGTVLESLGVLTTGGAAIKNELQAGRSARFKADGLLDIDRFESNLIGSASTLLNSVADTAAYPGSFDITGSVGGATINYTSSDTITSLKDKINLETVNTGVTASVVTDGNGVRLVLTENTQAAITLTDTNGLLEGLGVDNGLVLTRDSNTINDLFAGVTVTLFSAEEGTTIKTDIDRDLSQVKSKITAFVQAYNSVKQFINQNNLVDETSGEVTADTGLLFGDRALAQIQEELTQIIGSGVVGVDANFSVLAQIGVELVDNSLQTDPTQKDTLQINESLLDQVLLSNPDDVRRLFSFDFSSSDPRITLVGFDGNTSYDAGGYTLNIGAVFVSRRDSQVVTDKTAEISDAVNSFGATTSGTFDVNGTAIAYDADGLNGDDDTMESLATSINNAGIAGVSATVFQDSNGTYSLQISSTLGELTVDNDTGDLLANMGLTIGNYGVSSANINGNPDGSNDGSVTVSGRTLTATDATGAEGLTMLFSGDATTSGISLNYTTGIGKQMFFDVESMVEPTTGAVASEITSLEDQNDSKQDRLDRILERLSFERDKLIDRFIAMETALATMAQTKNFLSQFTDALANNKNN
jgi:flagellar hook-associated protein 2